MNNLGGKHNLLYQITKERNSSKNSAKTATWKLVPDPFVAAKTQAQPLSEMKFLKEDNYIWNVIARPSKFVQIIMLTSSDSFLQRIFWKSKRT